MNNQKQKMSPIWYTSSGAHSKISVPYSREFKIFERCVFKIFKRFIWKNKTHGYIDDYR